MISEYLYGMCIYLCDFHCVCTKLLKTYEYLCMKVDALDHVYNMCMSTMYIIFAPVRKALINKMGGAPHVCWALFVQLKFT